MAKVLITGGAGFIGFHLAQSLQDDGWDVTCLDDFNGFYYDPNMKADRSEILKERGIKTWAADIKEKSKLVNILDAEKPDVIMHLAAHAGVRHSLDNARHYIDNNIYGTQNLIEACEIVGIDNVVYASTSCVMAGNSLPWKEDDPTGHQLNPYGYTKMTNECQMMVSKIKNTIGLRFFTVYGPWGRPDMALFKFTKGILDGTEIDVFNYGDMKRDFTYVDDIVAGIKVVINRAHNGDGINEIYNIGRGEQVQLMDFIKEIEKNFGREAVMKMLPKHPADTQETWSDTTKLQALGWKPTTSISEGVEKFAEWYRNYYKVN